MDLDLFTPEKIVTGLLGLGVGVMAVWNRLLAM